MGRGQGGGRVELPCKFGKLVCEVVRDDGEYREFAIDLVRPDGRAYQVCVVGTDEDGSDVVHVHLWDGDHEDCRAEHAVNPDGEGYYCDGDGRNR